MSATTLLPFLYQTRTLAVPAAKFAQRLGTHVPARGFQPWKQNSDGGIQDIPFEYAQTTPPPPKPTRKDLSSTTLTPTERHAFEAIFADIEKRGLRPRLPQAETAENGEDIEEDIVFEGSPSPPEESGDPTHALRAILDHASAQYDANSHLRNPTGFDALSPIEQLRTPETNRGKLAMRYPSPLRQAAHKALHCLDADPIGHHPNTAQEGTLGSEAERIAAFERALKLEEIRREERAKVERAMNGAKSDVELWDIMERDVFSMIEKLGLADHQIKDTLTDAAHAKTKEQRKKKKNTKTAKKGTKATTSKPRSREKEKFVEFSKAVTGTEGVTREDVLGPGDISSVRIQGPLYPRYIMHGLKLFDSHFARSSPLALSILPRVKELGLTSYVLGVSTPFYNNLMHILWGRYGDVGAVLNLLEEMQITGLYLDEKSVDFLQHIRLRLRQYQSRSSDPAKSPEFEIGPFARHLAKMPEYDDYVRDRVGFWVTRAHRSIEERQRVLGF